MPRSSESRWTQGRSDAEAFTSLFDDYANAIYRYCFRRTADWALAEDLTSTVFLEAWRHRRKMPAHGTASLPWLFAVATNVMRNQTRALRRYRAVLARVPPLEPERDFADDIAERLDMRQQAHEMLSRLDRLPRREREVLDLYAEGLSTAQIATTLGIREGTVRSRLFRGRRRLGLESPLLRDEPEPQGGRR